MNKTISFISKPLLTFAILLSGTILTFGQETDNQKLISLGKNYKDFMLFRQASKNDLKDIQTKAPKNLKTTTEFIVETLTKDNKLLTRLYLSRPSNKVLKQIYIVREISSNLGDENQIDNNKLLQKLNKKDIPVNELIDNYYFMLFAGVGNKNQPFDHSKIDLKLDEYNLQNATEKGILVLKAMDMCGKSIWGYMNIPDPSNTKEAYAYITRFPKINGRKYYQYTDFHFADFEMNIIEGKGKQSYKSYYLNKFYQTLIYHLICLNKENKPTTETSDLLISSILNEKKFYKYTKYKKTLERIF